MTYFTIQLGAILILQVEYSMVINHNNYHIKQNKKIQFILYYLYSELVFLEIHKVGESCF